MAKAWALATLAGYGQVIGNEGHSPVLLPKVKGIAPLGISNKQSQILDYVAARMSG